jgi:hypothetical protein
MRGAGSEKTVDRVVQCALGESAYIACPELGGRGSHCGGDESRGERVGADVYRDSRVFDKYASNLIDQKNTRVRALKALISSECPIGFLRKISCSKNAGIIGYRKNQ